jgi:hypothetical protein
LLYRQNGYPARKSIRKAAAQKRAVASSRLGSEDKLGKLIPVFCF